jgi:hypothetical protein
MHGKIALVVAIAGSVGVCHCGSESDGRQTLESSTGREKATPLTHIHIFEPEWNQSFEQLGDIYVSVHVVANDDSELEVTVDGVRVPAICELSVHWLRQQMHVLRASIKGAGNSNGRRGECRYPQKMLAAMCVTGSVTFTNAAARPTSPSPLKSCS